ncbi:hypothetical protein ONE63_001164 [Megalurothrips usitatus]|uniref:BTB domain-containing protein n=1 Tax=Megalurothrips usitatus TaxID=439358 RepID=A0AAV7XFA3_9NEOP|nr:hypothetical protein ONE63_001164 [Megalurothrips usitatus]
MVIRVSTFAPGACGNCCDWAWFRHRDDLADVILVVADADVPVHKQVLCARSPVFRSMFTLDFKEKREMRVVVEGAGATPAAVHKFLEFLYSNEVKDFEGLELDVMLLADRYQVKDLKELCQEMFNKMNTDNVLETLVLSDAINAALLKRKALFHVVKNLAAVMASPGWRDFRSQHNDLVDDMLKEGMAQMLTVSRA